MGLVDISPRLAIKRHLGTDYFTLLIPYHRFKEMQTMVDDSFLKESRLEKTY